MSEDSSSVRVAVRIRPPLTREIIDGCQICTSVTPGTPQVWIGGNHAFTYDYCFDSDASQESVFQTVTGLVDGCLEGYNATILAYGQTGSGKTHTMGTGFDVESLNSTVLNENQGIIPRAVYYLFYKIDELRKQASESGHPPPEFKVSAQFVELYNEEVFDLIEPEVKKAPGEKPWVPHFRPLSSPPSDTDLTATAKSSSTGMNRRPQTTGSIKIHEDPAGGIYIVGIGTKNVETAESTMKCLRNGALSRTTASTNMNDQSSRSHAIFTLHIKQQRVVSGDEPESQTEFETLTAKFHFVDLAGSERLKRTGAVGERAKEGITINMGLLALGNVISALGDTSKRVLHVPYRDSKLTRLLQDSLGGNSRTVMIACVSPCDRDFVETLNSLKYANRARNIKNRITINQDKSSRTIALLKQEIQSLQNELLEYKQGKRSGCSGDDDLTDTWRENVMLHTEITSLKNRVKAMQETIEMLTTKNSELLAERVVQDAISNNGGDAGATVDLTNLVKGYMQEIEELRAKLLEAEATCESMRKSLMSPRPNKLLSPRSNTTNYNDINELIEEAKKEVEKEQDLLQRLHNTCDDSSASDSEDDDTENEPSMAADIQLANVTNEITMKLRLIEQLEASQARMEQMRSQYEQKLACLMNRIKATEVERDKVLSSVRGEDKVKQVKEDYEKKLTSLNSELKKWQSAQKEHARVLRNQVQYERQINTLRAEIDNMKRIKVKLMNQIKDEGIRWRDIETKRIREINQLKKEQRKKDIAIRALEGEARKKDVVLKRKLEEVNALKKIKTMSAKASGQIHLKVSPVKAKQKWGRIMTNMVKNVTTKQTLSNFEQEMLSLIEERKSLKTEIDSLMKDKVKLQMEMASPADLNTINEYIDNLSAKMLYVEEKVNELQRSIVELTSAREDEENPDLSNLVGKLNNQEVGYVFNKLYEQSVASMTECANSTKKETEAQERLKHTERELIVAQDLLRHIMLNHPESVFLPPELLAKFQSLKRDYQYEIINGSTESLPGSSSNGSDATFFVKPAAPKSERKARRLTATPSELLMGTNGSDTFSVEPELPDVQLPDEFKRVNSVRGSSRGRRNTYVVPPGETFNPPIPPSNASNDSARSTNSYPNRRPAVVASGVSRLKATNNNLATADRMNTTFLVDKSPEHDRYESPSNTPPGSPNSQRRTNNDNNVFQRLFGSQGNETGGVGIIRSVRGTSSSRNILLNVSIAEGHSKPVLSVFATEDKLFTGSKDSTAKIWDLTTGTEIQTLAGHPNNVLCVRYIEDLRLVLTTSHCYIKVWDFRMNGKTNCVKTLCSSGVMADDSVKFDPTSRLNLLPPGEQLVNCVCVGPKDMFTPFGDRVRRWDLRKFQSVGLLAGRHGSAVTCMALDESSFVTGSKDHSIKVYEYSNNASSTSPSDSSGASWTLEPPHYDGIETFAMQNRVLFSGSRDTCIKRWDLHRKEMVVSINNAHGGWITGLAFAPKNDSVFLSSGRDGMVKIWSVESCRELGKVDAHKGAVNCLATNSSLIFTGSQEGPVHIWKLRKSLDAPSSPDSSDNSP